MGILDKLRPQSKSTHPDPNIRIEAIHELDPADLESLNAFAKDDADARVRRVAVARIGDASVLADIVRNESEGSVRDHALGQLVEQASKHDAGVAMTGGTIHIFNQVQLSNNALTNKSTWSISGGLFDIRNSAGTTPGGGTIYVASRGEGTFNISGNATVDCTTLDVSRMRCR